MYIYIYIKSEYKPPTVNSFSSIVVRAQEHGARDLSSNPVDRNHKIKRVIQCCIIVFNM